MSSETTSTTPANVSSSVLGTDLTKPASFKQRIAGRGAQFALKQAGAVLSRKEARAAAKETGRSVTEIMGAAAQKGVGLGAGLVQQFNKGKFGTSMTGVMPAVQQYGYGLLGQSRGVTKALEALEPVRGLTLPKGTAYMGSATRETASGTETLPILMPRQAFKNAQVAAPTTGGYATPTQAGTAGESAATVTTPQTTVSPTSEGVRLMTAKEERKANLAEQTGINLNIRSQRDANNITKDEYKRARSLARKTIAKRKEGKAV